MSLTEKTEFLFFEFPIFRYSPLMLFTCCVNTPKKQQLGKVHCFDAESERIQWSLVFARLLVSGIVIQSRHFCQKQYN